MSNINFTKIILDGLKKHLSSGNNDEDKFNLALYNANSLAQIIAICKTPEYDLSTKKLISELRSQLDLQRAGIDLLVADSDTLQDMYWKTSLILQLDIFSDDKSESDYRILHTHLELVLQNADFSKVELIEKMPENMPRIVWLINNLISKSNKESAIHLPNAHEYRIHRLYNSFLIANLINIIALHGVRSVKDSDHLNLYKEIRGAIEVTLESNDASYKFDAFYQNLVLDSLLKSIALFRNNEHEDHAKAEFMAQIAFICQTFSLPETMLAKVFEHEEIDIIKNEILNLSKPKIETTNTVYEKSVNSDIKADDSIKKITDANALFVSVVKSKSNTLREGDDLASALFERSLSDYMKTDKDDQFMIILNALRGKQYIAISAQFLERVTTAFENCINAAEPIEHFNLFIDRLMTLIYLFPDISPKVLFKNPDVKLFFITRHLFAYLDDRNTKINPRFISLLSTLIGVKVEKVKAQQDVEDDFVLVDLQSQSIEFKESSTDTLKSQISDFFIAINEQTIAYKSGLTGFFNQFKRGHTTMGCVNALETLSASSKHFELSTLILAISRIIDYRISAYMKEDDYEKKFYTSYLRPILELKITADMTKALFAHKDFFIKQINVSLAKLQSYQYQDMLKARSLLNTLDFFLQRLGLTKNDLQGQALHIYQELEEKVRPKNNKDNDKDFELGKQSVVADHNNPDAIEMSTNNLTLSNDQNQTNNASPAYQQHEIKYDEDEDAWFHKRKKPTTYTMIDMNDSSSQKVAIAQIEVAVDPAAVSMQAMVLNNNNSLPIKPAVKPTSAAATLQGSAPETHDIPLIELGK